VNRALNFALLNESFGSGCDFVFGALARSFRLIFFYF
jgi:hypothetical protein